MATPAPGDIQILRNCILALINAHDNRTVSGDGLTDAKVAAISPATVAGLCTTITNLAGYHAADVAPDKTLSVSAIRIASAPMFPLPPVTSPAAAAAAGGSLADDTYYYAIAQVDADGNVGPLSAEVNATTSGTDNTVDISWTVGVGASSFIVYKGTATGVYTNYQAVSGSTTATVSDTGANFTGTVTTAPTAAGSSNAGYGLITDQMVQLAVTAGLYSTLYDAVAAQDSPATTSTAPLKTFGQSVPYIQSA